MAKTNETKHRALVIMYYRDPKTKETKKAKAVICRCTYGDVIKTIRNITDHFNASEELAIDGVREVVKQWVHTPKMNALVLDGMTLVRLSGQIEFIYNMSLPCHTPEITLKPIS